MTKTTTAVKHKAPLALIWVLGLLLCCNSFAGAYRYSMDAGTIDFFTWWAINHGLSHEYIQMPYDDNEQKKLAQDIRNELDAKQGPRVRERIFDDTLKLYDGRIIATATPFYYVAFSRFFSDNYRLDKRHFVAFSLICFALAVLIIGRLLNYSYLSLFLFYSLVTTWFSAYQIDIKVGNINQLQLLLIAGFIYFFVKGKKFYQYLLAGLWLGFCILLKPNTALILVCALLITLLNKEIKKTLAIAAGVGLSVVLAFWEVASYFKVPLMDLWARWLQTFPTTASGVNFTLEFGNYSISRQIFISTGINLSLFISAALACLFFYKIFSTNRYAARASNKVSQAGRDEKVLKEAFYAVGFGLLIMILGSNLVWSHYHLLAIVPLFLYFLRPHIETAPYAHPQWISVLTYVVLGLSTLLVARIAATSEGCSLVYNVVAVVLLSLLVFDK